MKPDIITRIVDIVIIAQVQRFKMTGNTKRAVSATRTVVEATESMRPQSVGGR